MSIQVSVTLLDSKNFQYNKITVLNEYRLSVLLTWLSHFYNRVYSLMIQNYNAIHTHYKANTDTCWEKNGYFFTVFWGDASEFSPVFGSDTKWF